MPPCQEGDLVELIEMPNDPCPIPPGTKGRVESVVDLGRGEWQVQVRWAIDRSLSLIYPVDRFKVIGSIRQIAEEAQAEMERLKAAGWTKEDFAKALEQELLK